MAESSNNQYAVNFTQISFGQINGETDEQRHKRYNSFYDGVRELMNTHKVSLAILAIDPFTTISENHTDKQP